MSNVATSPSSSTLLSIWIVNNASVTLLNKAAFQFVDFNYPFFLTAMHMLMNSIGSHLCSSSSSSAHSLPPPVQTDSHKRNKLALPLPKMAVPTIPLSVLVYSVLFTLNVAVGNVSLYLVPVAFNQTLRSLVPIMTMLLQKQFLNRPISRLRAVSVLPVAAGVAMTCWAGASTSSSSSSISPLGMAVTSSCVVLAALKAVGSNYLLTGGGKSRSQSPLEVLRLMAPLALLQCFALSFASGEISLMKQNQSLKSLKVWSVILLGSLASFTLNLSSLAANKATSPITLCVAANVKQAMMVLVSTVLFGNGGLGGWKSCGIWVALAGGGAYSYISIKEEHNQVELKKKK